MFSVREDLDRLGVGERIVHVLSVTGGGRLSVS